MQYLAHVAAMLKLAGIADARRQGRAHHGARNQDRAKPRGARRHRRRPEGQQSVGARRLCEEGAGPRLERVFRGCRPRQAAALHRLAARPRSSASRSSSRASRSTIGRTTSPSMSSTTTPTTCRRRLSRSASPSTARRCKARRKCVRAGSVRSTPPNEALGEIVGKLYVAKYFPASAKAELNTMVANIVAAYRQARRRARLDGRRRPKPRPSAS